MKQPFSDQQRQTTIRDGTKDTTSCFMIVTMVTINGVLEVVLEVILKNVYESIERVCEINQEGK